MSFFVQSLLHLLLCFSAQSLPGFLTTLIGTKHSAKANGKHLRLEFYTMDVRDVRLGAEDIPPSPSVCIFFPSEIQFWMHVLPWTLFEISDMKSFRSDCTAR